VFEHIRIVLVETSHPGNIGAAARAMKNMGLAKVVLVKPIFFPHGDATVRAAGADNILHDAVVVETLQEAIADCQVVIGTSTRQRSLDSELLSARQAGEKAMTDFAHQQVAIVFGRERTGLTNQELEYCHYRLCIPANPEYSSLNLSQAVQVVAYELRMASQLGQNDTVQRELMSADQMNAFYRHLETTLIDLEFLNPDNPGLLMRKLRRIFQRAQLDQEELNLLRGVWSAAQGRKIQYLKQRQADS
jgi:tRNA (cytidine32/uridine32-2'-O)-methyltransferase